MKGNAKAGREMDGCVCDREIEDRLASFHSTRLSTGPYPHHHLPSPSSSTAVLFAYASSELKLQPIRFPIVREYLCFTGEEVVSWLDQNVEGFGGNIDRVEQAAQEFTQREDLLRRIGDFGNALNL